MKIGGMGEQAILVKFWELRRLHELPKEVHIVGILPELPKPVEVAYVDCGPGRGPRPVLVHDNMNSPPLPPDWIPHPQPKPIEHRCLYIHVSHRYCFRGAECGAPLTIEGLDDFLKRFDQLRRQEELWRNEKLADHPTYEGSWVDSDA